MRLRVATYNIRKCIGLDWRRRPERTLDVIGELGADVVALQEADRRFGARLATLHHETLGTAGWRAAPLAPHAGGMGWHGNAILLGPEVVLDGTQRIVLPALEPRGAVIADLKVRGQPLRVVGTHLGLTLKMRVRQAETITAELAKLVARPTVIMGDLNEWSLAAGCVPVFAGGLEFVPPAPTFHAKRPVASLDRIAITPDIDLIDCRVHGEGDAQVASDHLPLWADLSVTATTGA